MFKSKKRTFSILVATVVLFCTIVPAISAFARNPFTNGQCTWWAYERWTQLLGYEPPVISGNAGGWYDNCVSRGYTRGSEPQKGAIICWNNGFGDDTGHVAVVEEVYSDHILISEYNWNITNGYNTANVYYNRINRNSSTKPNRHLKGYIYLPGSPEPSPQTEPFRYSIDSAPANGTTYHSSTDVISISGWALTTHGNGSGVTCVNLCVNGKDVRNCSRSQRNDVANVYPNYPNANAGFSCDINADILNPGTNTISLRAYATNVNQNDILVAEFGEYTVYYNPDYNLDGCIDSAEGGKGSVTVRGWAFDKDDSRSIDVHVYIGGEAGSGAPAYGIRADKERKDVGEIYGVGNNHGFVSTIPTDRVGEQTLYFYAIDPSGVGSKLLGSKTVTIQEDKVPIGVVDSASGGTDSITVAGWAYDADDTSKPVSIHIYAGGPAGSGKLIGNFLADKERKDLGKDGVGDYHGYQETITTDLTGTQTLYLYAIDIDGGNNGFIGSKTVNIKQGTSPQGSFDSIRGGKGYISVDGWAFDEDDTSKALDIHVYIGGEAGSGAPGYVIRSDKERNDVGNIYGVGDYHGYNDTITTNQRGQQEVYVYAIDAGSNQPNVLLGHKTVTIEEPDVSAEYVHTYTEEITKQATCTEQGECLYTCTCGDSYREIIGILPHTEVTDNAQAAACVKDGLTEGSHCSLCGIVIKAQEIIKKTDHKNTIVKFQKDATCVSAGYTGDTYCADCGIKLADGVFTKQLEHTMDEGVVLKNATESEAGITIFTCTVCETIGIKITPSIGAENLKEDDNHSHSYATEILTMPTYNSPGETLHVCACGEYFEESVPMSTSQETKYIITYHLDGGVNNALNPQEYTGKTLITLHYPSREGYTFQGWYTDNTFENEVTAIGKGSSGDLEFYAKWSKTSDSETDSEKITGIQLDSTSKLLQRGKTFTLTAKLTPSTASADTINWDSSDPEVASVTTNGMVIAMAPGTAVITATAKDGSSTQASCTITVPYSITYKLNQGSNNKNNPSYYYGQNVKLKNPVRKGYTFGGWYSDSKFKKKVTSIAKSSKSDITLYAKWNKVTVRKAAIKKITNVSGKKAKITINKVSDAKGYKILYSTDKKVKKNVKTVNATKTSAAISKLKKGKTYYVKICAYKLDSKGSKVYGAYSKIKAVKIWK